MKNSSGQTAANAVNGVIFELPPLSFKSDSIIATDLFNSISAFSNNMRSIVLYFNWKGVSSFATLFFKSPMNALPLPVKALYFHVVMEGSCVDGRQSLSSRSSYLSISLLASNISCEPDERSESSISL